MNDTHFNCCHLLYYWHVSLIFIKFRNTFWMHYHCFAFFPSCILYVGWNTEEQNKFQFLFFCNSCRSWSNNNKWGVAKSKTNKLYIGICIKRECNSKVSHRRLLSMSSLPLTNDRPDHKCSRVTEMLMMNIVMLMTEVLMIIVD